MIMKSKSLPLFMRDWSRTKHNPYMRCKNRITASTNRQATTFVCDWMPGQKRRHGINGFNTPSADNGYLIASRVAEDFDDDWLIFKSGVGKMSVHPTHSEWEGQTYDH